MGTGRPSSYTEDIGLNICNKLAQGIPLAKICEEPNMPSVVSVWRWLNSETMLGDESFRSAYARARRDQADYWFDSIVTIANEAALTPDAINKARLMIDARKWVVSKINPKKYGEKVTIDGDGEGGAVKVQYTDDERARVMKLFMEKAKAVAKQHALKALPGPSEDA